MTLINPNNDNKKIVGIAVILLVFSLWIWGTKFLTGTPTPNPVENGVCIAYPDLFAVQKPYFIAISATTTDDPSKDDIRAIIQDTYPELDKFAFCESTYRPEVCSYAGCASGMGICGFIPSTWNLTLKRMKKAEGDLPARCDIPIESVEGFETDKSHPVFDAECNLILCQWLYAQDGDGHWNSSKKCWKDL